MIALKSLFIALFAVTVFWISGHAQAQSRPTATMTLQNSTDATLRIELRTQFHSGESVEVLVPPLTEKRVTVPAGIVRLTATATKANPAKGFSDSLTLNNGSEYSYNITSQQFGTDHLTDRPIDALPGSTAASSQQGGCRWGPAGSGDIANFDIGRSTGLLPLAERCNSTTTGGAVCWAAGQNGSGGPWCTYKSLPPSRIMDGKGVNRGTVYGCQC